MVKKSLIIVFLILLIDQIIKFWVKLNFTLGEEVFLIGDWCRLHFIENEGMAFGMSFGEQTGKLILTLFRIVAATLIFLYLRKLVVKKENKLVIYAFTLIFAGAVGNIIDSLFYGLIFSESTFFTTAEFLSEAGGYAPLCLGKVVDMFYFPLIDTTLPQWIPFVGGDHFEFFNAIFNVADIAITVGVGLLIISAFKVNNKKKTIALEEIEEDTNK
ncbi:MAG: lipoprotein signal peptidase [Bacteroidales bacterium]|nr:lipoprotein signal peptidase [Bacteroidales bacterium]